MSNNAYDAAHLNGCSVFFVLFKYSIHEQLAFIPFTTLPHYSCTYWFVKQPIKLDMEVGGT